MKNLLFVSLAIILIIGCGTENRHNSDAQTEPRPRLLVEQINWEAKTKIIIDSVLEFTKVYNDSLVVQNYLFLQEYVNKLQPLTVEKFGHIGVYKTDTSYNAETSITVGSTQAIDFLNSDEDYGQISLYGIRFNIDSLTGSIKSYSVYMNFDIWEGETIGARKHVSSKWVEIDKNNIFDIRKRYGNQVKMRATDEFYESDMVHRKIKL